MRVKLLKCTNVTCGKELPETDFYKAPGNNQRNNKDYFCKVCRNERRKELREAKQTIATEKEPLVLCHGPCGLHKPKNAFHERKEYANRHGVAYWCQVCLKKKPTTKSTKKKQPKTTTVIDDAYIYC